MTCPISVAQQQASRSRESGLLCFGKTTPRNERDQPPEQDRDRKGAAISSTCSWQRFLDAAPVADHVCHEGRGMQVFPLEHVLIGVLWLAVTLFVIAAVLGWIG